MVVFGLRILARRVKPEIQGHKIVGSAAAAYQIDQANPGGHAVHVTGVLTLCYFDELTMRLSCTLSSTTRKASGESESSGGTS